MRSGKEMQRKKKEQGIEQIYTQISWETERTDLRVTEYHYPPFDRGWRKTSKTRVAPKRNTKNNVRKTK
jgi:hypothetical protein